MAKSEHAALLEGLNEEQRAAVTADGGPLLIVAGAGTGKTTVITKRIAWLIQTGRCAPSEILALTFTDKAAGEMEERVDRLLPYGYVNVWISTFHAFCERILRRHAIDIGLSSDFTLLDTTAVWLVVRQNLDRFNLEYYRPLGNPTKFIHELIKHFSRAKDEAIFPAEYLEHASSLTLDKDTDPSGAISEAARIAEVANAYHVYEQLLLEKNALDFGGLIVFTLKLFRERPAILAQYQEQFKYLLVDEFQDTNWAQYELVKLLAGDRRNITVVGDDDQSVYKFRGASLANILQFKKDFPDSAEVFLKKNYRSCQNILDCAYEFIKKNNPNRLEWQLNEGREGAQFTKKLHAATDILGTIRHLQCATHEDEAQAVVQTIVEYTEAGASWSDCAILVRSNDSAAPFISKCEELGIPYLFVNQRGLYSKPVILDVLSYLRLLLNYHDSVSLYRCLHAPQFDISASGLIELNHYAHQKGITLWQACAQADAIGSITEEDRAAIRRLMEMIARHAALVRSTRVPDLFLRILSDIGYAAYLTSDDPDQRAAAQLLVQFHKKMAKFQEGEPNARLRDFLQYVALEQEAGEAGSLPIDLEGGPDTVKIMTIHASKGLEFDHVFVVHLVDRRFPTTEREDAIEMPERLVKEQLPEGDIHLEEERRLFYVAMTRARKSLYFTSAHDYGGSRKKKPSQFLHEVGLVQEVAEPLAFARESLSIPQKSSGSKGDTVAPERLPGVLAKEFSFTRLAAFEKCPLQYKYAFILSIPTFSAPSAVFGKTIHKTLQEYLELLQRSRSQGSLFGDAKTVYTLDDLPSVEKLIELYNKNIPEDWYADPKTKQEYSEKGLSMLRAFYAHACATVPQPYRLEHPFRLKIPLGNDFVVLKGQIDRIDALPDGSLELVDYKTGKSKEKLRPEDRDQLVIYAIAADKEFGKPVSRARYFYLEDGTEVEFEVKEKDRERVMKKITETVAAIQESDFAPTPDKITCRFCDYRTICEYRKI